MSEQVNALAGDRTSERTSVRAYVGMNKGKGHDTMVWKERIEVGERVLEIVWHVSICSWWTWRPLPSQVESTIRFLI